MQNEAVMAAQLEAEILRTGVVFLDGYLPCVGWFRIMGFLIWGLPQMGLHPQMDGLMICLIEENPMNMDDLGVPPFMETPICFNDILIGICLRFSLRIGETTTRCF